MEAEYGTPIKFTYNNGHGHSSYKFFENYNIKCLMDEMDVNDKENITSGNKPTGKKLNSPMSNYKHIYKILHTSTLLNQSPTSAKRPLPHKLSSIVSLDCIENLNEKFDTAESVNLNSNFESVGFTQFIDHMKKDAFYAEYFVKENENEDQGDTNIEDSVGAHIGNKNKSAMYANIVSKLIDLLN